VALCLAGLSPAVVTETLFGLAVGRRPRVIPDEVHILTTGAAYPAVVGQLLGPRGALARLRRDYRLPADRLRCDPSRVHLLRDGRGRPIDDIRSALDSRAAGDCIRDVVRQLARDPATELHCSLAGGRKTMSALLATALQLYGRPQDRLYHVLVSEPFERVADFLYPPRRPVRYRVDGRWVSTRQAEVVLVEIPFVALGTVTRRLGFGEMDLEALAAELEAEATGRLRPDPLLVDLEARRVVIGDRPVRLAPRELALYALYAEARRACGRAGCRDGDRCEQCHLGDDEVHDRRERLSELYTRAGGRGRPDWAGAATTAGEALEEFRAWLRQTRSRVNGAIARALGPGPRGHQYTIAPMDRTGDDRRGRRGLGVPPGAITVRAGRARAADG
jgi:CRISPR-associated protein (TIGR02584 family)